MCNPCTHYHETQRYKMNAKTRKTRENNRNENRADMMNNFLFLDTHFVHILMEFWRNQNNLIANKIKWWLSSLNLLNSGIKRFIFIYQFWIDLIERKNSIYYFIVCLGEFTGYFGHVSGTSQFSNPMKSNGQPRTDPY